MTLLAIDPGRSTGLAWYQASPIGLVLVAAHAGSIDDPAFVPAVIPTHVVIEIPQVYPHGRASPNDLIELAVTAGRWIERMRGARILRVHPRTWKGKVPKAIHHARIEADLHDVERAAWAAIPSRGASDARDAVGLGQWARSKYPW